MIYNPQIEEHVVLGQLLPRPRPQRTGTKNGEAKNTPRDPTNRNRDPWPLHGLTIIGESINDSVPSTKKLFDAGDIAGLLELARFQDERGAAFIDVNVGARSPEFMADMVRKIQSVTAKPLSIDTPDPDIARAGLEAYDPRRAGGQKPILNSITSLRAGMFDLYKVQPFRPILLVSEHVVDGRSKPCRTAEETYAAAKYLVAAVPGAMPRRDQRRLHHRSGHRADRQRFARGT